MGLSPPFVEYNCLLLLVTSDARWLDNFLLTQSYRHQENLGSCGVPAGRAEKSGSLSISISAPDVREGVKSDFKSGSKNRSKCDSKSGSNSGVK